MQTNFHNIYPLLAQITSDCYDIIVIHTGVPDLYNIIPIHNRPLQVRIYKAIFIIYNISTIYKLK